MKFKSIFPLALIPLVLVVTGVNSTLTHHQDQVGQQRNQSLDRQEVREGTREGVREQLIKDHNRQIIKLIHESFKRGDIASILQQLSVNVDWKMVGPESSIPWARNFRGIAGAKDFFQLLGDAYAVVEFTPTKYISDENMVVSLGHYTFQNRKNGQRYTTDFSHIFTLKEGKVTKMRAFSDTSALLETLTD